VDRHRRRRGEDEDVVSIVFVANLILPSSVLGQFVTPDSTFYIYRGGKAKNFLTFFNFFYAGNFSLKKVKKS